MTVEQIEVLKAALQAWDAYEPETNTDRIIRQAEAMAAAIRAVLDTPSVTE